MQKIAERARPLQPQECVEQFFSLYDFPVLLAAEWGHVDRLLHVLNRPDTPVSRQRLILTLLGETRVARGYPVVVEKLKDGHLAKEAAEALAFFLVFLHNRIYSPSSKTVPTLNSKWLRPRALGELPRPPETVSKPLCI